MTEPLSFCRRARLLVAGVAAILAGCATPPPAAYVAAGTPPPAAAIGRNAVGETCTLQDAGQGAAVIYCGSWQQPSARLRQGEVASAADLPGIAAASPWRAALDARYVCESLAATSILDHRPAELLACTERRGGWPHVALAAWVNGRVWYADGVLAAAPVMERAIGVRTGLLRADAPVAGSAADALLAQRLAAQSVSAGDIGQFDALMGAGTRANLAGNPAAAEAAFRAALVLQQQALGAGNPNTAGALMTLALQLSDEGRHAEAAALFARADRLAPAAADPIAPARLLHYRGLDALNQDEPARALALLGRAAAGYAALLPPDLLRGATHPAAVSGFAQKSVALIASQELLSDPTAQSALPGLIEVRRNEAVILRRQGRLADSAAALAAATALSGEGGMARPILAARLYRSDGVTAAAAGDRARALTELDAAAHAFGRALPQSKSLADTELLRAGELWRSGAAAAALGLCQRSVADLVSLAAGTSAALIAPCLDAFGTAAAAASGAPRQALLAGMFAAVQLAQGGVTSQQIAQATARLQENARDPRVAAAIRRREDAGAALQSLYRRRDELAAAAGPGDTSATLDGQIRVAAAAFAEADAALQAASPNFAQLTQLVVPAAAVFAALYPHEALAELALGPDDGWVLLLHDGQITAGKIPLGSTAAGRLVARLRAGFASPDPPPAAAGDAIASARALYAATLAPVADALADVTRLAVVPSGPLLALPFEALLTGPADPAHLADAPWLVRRMTLVHVPAPGNFVSLRRIANSSRATRPWFGFGDFVPVTLAAAQRSFAGGDCGASAALLAGLPPLPYAQRELAAARALLGGGADDQLLGPAFTVPAVLAAPLRHYRVLHFAAHALLPAELRCQSQPAIVTSTPAGAADAHDALLTAADVTGLDLDAELVILSACNSGGPGDSTAGESLSGLARAFFYAGARTLLVTHWAVNDQVAAYLVAGTLARLHADPRGGVAAALRAAQLALLADAGHGLPAAVAQPFFWAPFAVIGDGGGMADATAEAARAAPPAL